jgi:Kdo2-lipid IVA lauroyltransferase/acyltransferase
MSAWRPPTFDRWQRPPCPAWESSGAWESLPLAKRLRRGGRALVVVALAKALRFLPYDAACALGRGVGSLVFRLSAGLRRATLANLARAFPERAEAERRRIARDSLRHFGQLVMEIMQDRHADRHVRELVELSPGSVRVMEEALAEGRGVVAATGHIGNWEIGGRRVTAEGFPLFVVSREQFAPALTRWFDRSRQRAGIGLVWRRPGQPVADALVRLLQQNVIVALLCDQDAKVRSVFVPFFGHQAATPRGPGELVLRTGAPLLAVWMRRLPGNRHSVVIERVTLPPRSGDHERDVTTVVAAATAALERGIRASPAEWTWFHDRWRRRPADEEADPAA